MNEYIDSALESGNIARKTMVSKALAAPRLCSFARIDGPG